MAEHLSPPWTQNADGTWSYAPDDAPVRLTADTEPDGTDPWHVPRAEADALAESDEWREYVRGEVAYYVGRLDEIG